MDLPLEEAFVLPQPLKGSVCVPVTSSQLLLLHIHHIVHVVQFLFQCYRTKTFLSNILLNLFMMVQHGKHGANGLGHRICLTFPADLLLDSAMRLSFSLRKSAFSPSILAFSSWICLSSRLTALICGATSGWSATLANSAFRSSMARLVLLIRFWWSSSSICFSLNACLMSSTCTEGSKLSSSGSFLFFYYACSAKKYASFFVLFFTDES